MAAIYWEFQPEGQFVVPVGRYRSNKYWVYMIFCKPEVLTIYFCKRLRKIYYSSNEYVRDIYNEVHLNCAYFNCAVIRYIIVVIM